MSVPVHCPHCGLTFVSRQFHIVNAHNITFSGMGEECPRCHRRANVQDGTYDFVGGVVRTFMAPGVARQTIYEFRDVAERARAGKITVDEAATQIAKLGPAFLQLWNWANENAAALGLLLAIITLYLMVTQGTSAEHVASEQLEATQMQTQVIRSAAQVEKRILEELQKQPQGATEGGAVAQPKPPKKRASRKPGLSENQRIKREEFAWKRRNRWGSS